MQTALKTLKTEAERLSNMLLELDTGLANQSKQRKVGAFETNF